MTSETLQSFAIAIAAIPAVFLGLWMAATAMALQTWASLRTTATSDVLASVSIGLERLVSPPPSVENKMVDGTFDEEVIGRLVSAWSNTDLRDSARIEDVLTPVLDAIKQYAEGLNAVRAEHAAEMARRSPKSAGAAHEAKNQLEFEDYWRPLTHQVERARNSLLDYIEATRIWRHVRFDLKFAPVAGLTAASALTVALLSGTHSPSMGERPALNLTVAAILTLSTSALLVWVAFRLRALRTLTS
ncbi:MAG: hypothetical protein Q8M79_05410 [Dehalococcoidia bacterium]|nr:hypothetical protein [Dehalococcoidia bacterium]